MSEVGERELLAIIFTDAVDSTARTASDEDYSLRILLADLDYMRNEAAVRGGTVLKNTGDGLLISFKSAVDAVECALSIQRGFANRSENSAFTHKIGVHIGDVIKKDGDIYGSGVNTASRLVAQCPAGGLCMSSTLYELVKQKSQIGQLNLKDFQLTNIEPPIKAYCLYNDNQDVPSAKKVLKKRSKRITFPFYIIGAFIFVLGVFFSSKYSLISSYTNKHQGDDKNPAEIKDHRWDLKGVWQGFGDSGPGRCYVSQKDNSIVVYSEESPLNPQWSHVICAEIKNNIFKGTLYDMPKANRTNVCTVFGEILNNDEIIIRVNDFKIHLTRIPKTDK